MTDLEINIWNETCNTCKIQKPNMTKARCQLYYAICVARSQTALDNVALFVGQSGTCKMYVPKGDSDGESQDRNKNRPNAPANW